MNRRSFLISSANLAVGALATHTLTYRTLVEAETQTHPSTQGKTPARETSRAETPHLDLIQAATLAPSSHNTQPWEFHLTEKRITILPDFSRRCPVVDPDDHHLFVSLGCATENLIQAANAQGLKAEPNLDLAKNKNIALHLTSTRAPSGLLHQAIATRQCTRTEYDGKPLTSSELNLLVKAGSGPGVHCHLLTDKSSLNKILDFVIEANTTQMNNPAFMTELKHWIRFNEDEARASGDGLYSATVGSPSIPTWLGKLIFRTVYTKKHENEKYVKKIRSSAGIAIFVSEHNDIKHWIEAGRCFERFTLQATLLNIRNAMINQPVEVAELRPVFAKYLGLGSLRPDLVVRFGRGPATIRSFRRPCTDLITV